MPKGDLGELKEKRMSTIFFFWIFIFIIPGFIHGAIQHRMLNWNGDVKIRTSNGFIQLRNRIGGILLRNRDAIFIPDGGEVLIRFHDGTETKFYGPRFTTVRKLKNAVRENRSQFMENFLRITSVIELLTREAEDNAGPTRGDKEIKKVYQKISRLLKSKGTELRDMPIHRKEEDKMNIALSLVESHFDAFSLEEQLFMKAKIFKHFNQHRQALMTVFSHYKTLRGKEQKEKERLLLEDVMFCQLLPINIHFKVASSVVQGGSRRVSIALISNFKLWWAAFFYNSGKFEVIKKSYDNTREPMVTFEISRDITSHSGTEPFYVFIIAFANAYEYKTFDDMTITSTILLDESISETVPGTVKGFSRVIIKVRL